MLLVENLTKSFDKKPVLTEFNYSFQNNSIYMLAGPNGVGKTTLLKMIKGIITPDQGAIALSCGSALKHYTSYIDANNRSFLHRLTVKENLLYFLALNKQPRSTAIIESLMEEFRIGDLLDQVFSVLSVGQMQLIAFIRGLLEQPELLLLDEALTNIDQQRVEIISAHLEAFVRDNERIVILCSHNDNLPMNITGTVQLG
jgi:ABC-type multidrug transport system ATPase subunit